MWIWCRLIRVDLEEWLLYKCVVVISTKDQNVPITGRLTRLATADFFVN